MVPALTNGFKLGKKAAKHRHGALRLVDFVDKTKLPPAPDSFGHDHLIPDNDWGTLGNDSAGDCVMAFHAHAVMLWNATAGRTVRFTDAGVLSDYSAVTGYNPRDPQSDQGTDMMDAANYARTTGVIDAYGQRHKIAGSLTINPGSLSDMWSATYLGGIMGIGVQLPQSADDQFNSGQEWTYVRGSPNLGGHCVGFSGKRGNVINLITWGRRIQASVYWLTRYCDEAHVYFSEESLINGRSVDGFDREALMSAFGLA